MCVDCGGNAQRTLLSHPLALSCGCMGAVLFESKTSPHDAPVRSILTGVWELGPAQSLVKSLPLLFRKINSMTTRLGGVCARHALDVTFLSIPRSLRRAHRCVFAGIIASHLLMP